MSSKNHTPTSDHRTPARDKHTPASAKHTHASAEHTPASDQHTPSTQNTTRPHHATRYFFVGLGVTLFNYVLYSILANLIVRNNDLLWLSSLIGTVITTLVAYLLHSRITWKERQVTKTAIIKFFIWNACLAIAISPALTQLFSLLTPVYQLAYNIFAALHLPFSYEFTLSTGAFGFTCIVTMILNFLFYDRFVFGKNR